MSASGRLTLEVFPGEIVGVAGVGGNGQDELVACCGRPRRAGRGPIVVGGRDLTEASTASFRAAGVGYASPDRADEGLCLAASIRDNFVAGREREPKFSRLGVMRRSPIDAAASRALDLFSVRFDALADPAASLSGGNQQRLVRRARTSRRPAPACCVAAHSRRRYRWNGLHTHADRDLPHPSGAVLLVSEALNEILALSDRMVCLFNGQIVGEVARAEASVETVGRMMLGRKAAA